MARYGLILPDDVYFALLKQAAAQGLSFGKFVNIALRQLAEAEAAPGPVVCWFCGEPAAVEAFNADGRRLLLCDKHRGLAKYAVGSREL